MATGGESNYDMEPLLSRNILPNELTNQNDPPENTNNSTSATNDLSFIEPSTIPIPRDNNIIGSESQEENDAVTETEHSDCEDPIGDLINACHFKILCPYSLFLSLIGWLPLFNLDYGAIRCKKISNVVYLIAIVILLIFGHILEFASCFRRDGFALYRNSYEQELLAGNVSSFFQSNAWNFIVEFLAPIKGERELNNTTNKTDPPTNKIVCTGGLLSTYAIPSLLHMAAYVCMCYNIRRVGTEKLVKFMERTFLQLRKLGDKGMTKAKLVCQLRCYFYVFGLWLIIPFVSFGLQFAYCKQSDKVRLDYTWMRHDNKIYITILDSFLVICMVINYLVSVAVATCYVFQCKLLEIFLENLRVMVKNRIIGLLEFYEELNVARNFLEHLNGYHSISVGLICVNVASKLLTASYGFFAGQSKIGDSYWVYFSSVVICFYWSMLLASSSIHAASVNSVCEKIKSIGHAVKGTPETEDFKPSDPEVDSLIIYLSSLEMEAKLFCNPIRTGTLAKITLVIFMTLVTFGQLGLTYFSSF